MRGILVGALLQAAPKVMSIAMAAPQSTCQPVQVVLQQMGMVSGSGKLITDFESLADFYNPNRAIGSFSGELPTGANRSLVTFHQNLNTCDTSLVIVHSQPSSGATLGWARMTFNGLNLSDPVVKDDSETFLFSDSYSYDANSGSSTVTWSWLSCCTDGLGQSLGADWVGCLQVVPEFSPTSIQEWMFVSGVNRTVIELSPDLPLTVCIQEVTPKPSVEPSFSPTVGPSFDPSTAPSKVPTSQPSQTPSIDPTQIVQPTFQPAQDDDCSKGNPCPVWNVVCTVNHWTSCGF